MIQISRETEETVLFKAREDEFEILISTFEVVMNTIHGGFHARIGADREEVKALLLRFQSALKTLRFKNQNISHMGIKILVDELRILVQILNEACNGIEIPDFEFQIGTNETTLESFLHLQRFPL